MPRSRCASRPAGHPQGPLARGRHQCPIFQIKVLYFEAVLEADRFSLVPAGVDGRPEPAYVQNEQVRASVTDEVETADLVHPKRHLVPDFPKFERSQKGPVYQGKIASHLSQSTSQLHMSLNALKHCGPLGGVPLPWVRTSGTMGSAIRQA